MSDFTMISNKDIPLNYDQSQVYVIFLKNVL
jgi:hypothetical protein